MFVRALRRVHWFLHQQIGIELVRVFRAPFGLLRFARDLVRFRYGNAMPLRLQPCLHDWWEEAGAARNEYFWQDLRVAQMIFDAAPRHHIDVGSRLDGFVAHVASFRQLEVFDVRPLHLTIPGVRFYQADLMRTESLPRACTDSLSCLHAIEHFGLGRYGDPIEPEGVVLGLRSLSWLLEEGGTLYLSCPTGEDVVHFNAHRAMKPATVASLASRHSLVLEQCWLFDARSHSFDEVAPLELRTPAPTESLALYVFRKRA